MSKNLRYENLYIVEGNITAHRLKEHIYGLLERIKKLERGKSGAESYLNKMKT